MPFSLPQIQSALQDLGLDAWLFLDFRRRDFLAYDILDLPEGTPSRRWAYLIPAHGSPKKLLHRIEPQTLASLPGESLSYSTWPELQTQLTQLLTGTKTIAMQYSPMAALPYLSTVDAGTLELVRSTGVTVTSSAPLVARFQGLLTPHQIQTHITAAPKVHRAKDDCFSLIQSRARAGNPLSEREAADFITHRFSDLGLLPEGHTPNVSAGPNAANPHYDPPTTGSALLTNNTPILIDLWAKLANDPLAVVYDITWCAWLGPAPVPPEYAKMFDTVVAARNAAESLIRTRYANAQPITGAEADDAARHILLASPYAKGLFHRTGHAIDTRTHGSGVNLDNFETQDSRPLLPGACFSIEPGLYLPPYGVRSEINMLITPEGSPETYGPKQEGLLLL